ncbi:hypothetical protein [Virgibacillus chiguensis]|uniref:hypothetical protein n=1 Tax=Virgibacillus chiguensis TaxID=411959 RepID=UPI0011153D33|nr:hypothetical protein [Virgibacillus chiguensis]
MHLDHHIVRNVDYDNHFIWIIHAFYGTTNSSWYYDLTYRYTITPDGKLQVAIAGIASGRKENAPPMLQRIGVKIHYSSTIRQRVLARLRSTRELR